MQVHWILKSFPQLTVEELYALLRLRNEVFIVEQNCPFPDLDGKDPLCHHLLGFGETGCLLAYTRLVPPGVIYRHPSIGRVATALNARRFGKGRELMQRSLVEMYHLYGQSPIQIGAQSYLQAFYESFGFLQSGDAYLEDGIEHIPMTRTLS
ncbi:GNAT family N-acetyltransferase [Salmonirosea aquatica]|uniref:GNAT family N-acetyltransferase n=1 Tax=Salmonirosea aquatica TaxID=2654236 RepID=A0A7C9FBG7_9BACT|nr:GNAT family N-acetyltransferase [Cytophagaceae bacterium SJW1-29]